MTSILATVNFPHLSGLSEDVSVNTFAFSTDISVAAAHAAITTRLENFYNGSGPGSESIGPKLGVSLSRAANAVKVKYYDITGFEDGSPHGAPVQIDQFTLAALPGGANVPLPEEVALCLSFHSDFAGDSEFVGATRPRARDRGRVYVGPLNTSSVTTDGATGGSRPTTNVKEAIAEAASRLADSGAASLWCVWSRADAALKSVVGGWVDNAWDTQRRRGYSPDSRVLWTP